MFFLFNSDFGPWSSAMESHFWQSFLLLSSGGHFRPTTPRRSTTVPCYLLFEDLRTPLTVICWSLRAFEIPFVSLSWLIDVTLFHICSWISLDCGILFQLSMYISFGCLHFVRKVLFKWCLEWDLKVIRLGVFSETNSAWPKTMISYS